MVPGHTYNIGIRVRNTGNTTWSAESNYRLGSQNPDNNSLFGPHRVYLTTAVAPNQEYTFSFPVARTGSRKNRGQV